MWFWRSIGQRHRSDFRKGDGFLSGEVVDFIDLQWWPIFNFADMALVIGLPLLLYYRYQVERNLADG